MLYQQIETNKRKTILLVILFCIVAIGVGWAIGYWLNGDMYSGIIITAIVLAFYVPMTYMSASSQVLKMSRAKEASREEYPQLYNIMEELVIPARLPMPKIYVIDDPAPNAFATGVKPEKASVAFTTGLIEQLNREELTGVAAHELAHIRNYDVRLMTICIALVSVIILITEFGSRMLFYGGRSRRSGGQKGGGAAILMVIALVAIILAPIVSQMIRFAISRNREFLADATAVEFTRNPYGLIRALEKISSDKRDVKGAKDATAAMYISRPLNRKKKNKRSLFATHPPMEDRIARLQKM